MPRAARRHGTPQALLLLAALARAGCSPSDMDFAIVQNKFYAKMHHQREDRGFHTIYGFLGLLHRHADVPDVFGGFTTIAGDSVRTTDTPGVMFSFSRRTGDRRTHNWPSHDFTGWATAWIAPLEVVEGQLSKEMVPWAQRAATVFWTGAVNGISARQQYLDCAKAEPQRFAIGAINWSNVAGLRADRERLQITGSSRLKPVQADLRRLMHYKYLIYLPGNSWSSSIKRLILAGAAVIVPEPNPHESMVFEVLRECKDCLYTYSLGNLCSSLHTLFSTMNDTEARVRAKRLNAFARERFSPRAVEAYMMKTLRAAARQQLQAAAPMRAADVVRQRNLTLVTCKWLKARHKALLRPALAWQVEEWFDDDCVVKDTGYLRYTAI